MLQEAKLEGEDWERGKRFAKHLLKWNRQENQRQMPWKGEKDPYRIWISEIILQQTRVEQGLNYYKRFILAFPTIQQLAEAPEQEVFKLWEGLGYYSRCRNLIATARYVTDECNGVFPSGYHSILQLKGIGAYTAAAIASFAYNLPHAVVDGNVYRVLSRIFDLDVPIDSTSGKKKFSALAQKLLPARKAGEYNQAIMDFGATICKPVPDCGACFFSQHCIAFLEGKQQSLPVKSKKAISKDRWFHYVIVEHNGKIAIRERTGKDIWRHLHEWVLIEGKQQMTQGEVVKELKDSFGLAKKEFEILAFENGYRQQLSHQRIYFSFLHLILKEEKPLHGFIWVFREKLEAYPFPKTLQQFLANNL